MPSVSVIMPYYKKELYIEESIRSILNQSHQNFEVILINDEINVNNIKFLEKISNLDARIKLIPNGVNLGAGKSRNRALQFSKGEYIAFCDCDDLWKYNKLELQLNFMKKLDLNFSFTSYEIVDEYKNLISIRKANKDINFNQLRNSCDIGLSTVIIKKKIFDNNKFQFPNLKTKEDYVLWMILAKNNIKMMGLDQNLTSWRKNKNSLSSSIIQKMVDGYKVYRLYLKYGRLQSLFFLLILSINFILKK